MTVPDSLFDHPLVHDVVVLTRTAGTGRTYRVAYVVPAPAASPTAVRRAVSAAALGTAGPPLLISVVTAIPRDAKGNPDEAALCRLPVPESVEPQPVPAPDPRPGRRHLGELVELPPRWTTGPLPAHPAVDVAADGPPSLCGGDPLEQRPADPATLVDALLANVTGAADRGVHVVEAGHTRFLSYPDLVDAALRTLTGLRAAGLTAGDAAILHTPSLAEHIVALWGCLLGGIRPLAVAQAPAYDVPNSVLDKLENAWRDLDRPVVLSGGSTVAALPDRMRVVDLAECAGEAPAESVHRPEPADVAMLQLSSGSTGRSKLIQLTHRGIIRYVQGSRRVMDVQPGDGWVNWLPLDHVAGVVMFHFGPVVDGCDNVQAPPAMVLADPLLWLDLLHRYRAAHSWSPNFGYKLVTEALARRPGRGWDLRRVRNLVNAGEQCTEPVMRGFVDALRHHGISERSILLAWGMAETCTAITYERFGQDAIQHVRQDETGRLELLDGPESGTTTFLSMGRPAPGAQFRIAGADGRTVLPELHIGRLQGRSERVTPGYLNNPEANAEAFPDGEWFDTGDLAFVAGGRVTITGRAKEIIIINGVHFYCHEIEDVVGALDGVAASFVAAFGVPSPDGIERMVVVFVPDGPLTPATVGGIRRRLSERFGLASVLLAAVDRDGFDKTTSGKIQRAGMRGRLLAGELTGGVRAVELAESGPDTMPDAVYVPQWTPRALAKGRQPERVLLISDELTIPGAMPAPAFDRSDPARWRELLTRLRSTGRTPSHIVLATSYLELPALADEPALNRALDVCSTEVLAIGAALAADGWAGELITVSRGLHRITGAEPGCYPAALTEAIGETLALERPELRSWHLDLPGTERDAEVLAEALCWSHREPVLAWRDRPMVRGLRPAELVAGAPNALPPGSRWLVTGGRGGIGRAVLPGLGLRLLVVGRAPAADPDVRYAQVDVTDGAAIEAAVADAERDWGAGLTGVLHLAGHYELATLADTPPALWRNHTSAKVEGSLAVARVLARRPGARLVAFSSLMSLLPSVGSSAYVAGNRFLEALCAHLSPDTPVHCLSWGLWRGVGINAEHDYSEAANRGRMLAFSPADGRALLTAAAHQPPGTLLLGVDPAAHRVRGMLPARALEAVRRPASDAFGTDLPVGVETVAAQEVLPSAAVGADRLGIARIVRETLRQVVPGGIPSDTPFYEAGLGSVRLLQLHGLLQQGLSREFPLTTLFSHPTETALVRQLSALIEPEAPRHERSGGDGRVAIIGMAARFPGANTLDRYWANIVAGTVSTRRFGRPELLAAGLPESLVDDPDFVPVSGALDDIAGFDAELFGISAGEAALTDPQQRLFLQICHEALEHGGYAGTPGRVGVFAGSGMQLYSLRTYFNEHLAGTDPGDQLEALRVAIGNEPDFLATRVAYKLGLTGPAVAVRSACSTSLVAVHLAVRALLAGEADLALAGAAALHVPGVAGYRHQEGSILSRSGACRAFDAAADGTVGGNGVAAVLLKPLAAALADGDTVHAVILGSAINNDGSDKVGYTSPSVSGQVRVIRDALATAGVAPASVGYVEAHGTGTALGDPIEVDALREVFAERSEPLPLGSVKANIGHLDSCAGMAGLIKTVLALRHGLVPPLAGFRSPNPALRLDGLIELPAEPRPWPGSGPRRAGVSALGVGGTNAHLVLEQAPPPAARETTPVSVVPLSARNPDALAELARLTADALSTEVSGADVLTTLGAGRRRLPHRLVALGDTAEETAAALRDGGSVTGVLSPDGPGPLVFAFTGQGVDCAGAAAGLFEHPVAREVLERCAEQHRQTWGADLFEPPEWTTAAVQPALLAMQLATARLLEHLGIRPDVLIGHSVGEYAALCVAGALSIEDAMHLAAVRGALLESGVADGGMVAVLEDPGELPGLSVAVRNGPGNQVLAGPVEAVDAAEELLTSRGVKYRRLPVTRAFHTSAMDPVLDELARQTAGLHWQPLRLPVFTGLGGVALPPGTVLGPDHVRRHTREPADYAAGIEHLTAQGCTTFVELGPAPVLTALGRQWPDTAWIPLRRKGSDSVIPGLAELWCRGVEVDWAALAPGGRRIPLPTYPFQLTRHWATTEGDPMTPEPLADTATDAVLARVCELTARHMGEPPDRIQPEVPFFDLGADSLLMINMVRELEAAFGVRVSMRELFEEVDTPARLSAVIVARMEPDRRTGLAPEPVAPQPVPVRTEAPAVAQVPDPPVTGAPAGTEALVREQLSLMGRFTELMSEQLAALQGPQRHVPASQGKERDVAGQLGPRATVAPASGMTGGRLNDQQQAHFADLVRRYTERTKTSKDIAQRYRKPLADSRAVVGFRSATKELLYPIAARRARGAYLEDVDGNTYVDITMGFGTLMFGHEPAFLVEAVQQYLADGLRLGPRGEETGQAAELLCELTGLDRAAFATSGTEANSGAFRLARAFTGRTMIVTFDGSYHGHFDPVLGRTVPDGDRLRTVPVSAGIPDSAVSETLVLPYGDESSLDTIRRRADRIAAVVLEAVPSRHPDRRPVEFVRALRELCDRHGIVLMFDEMLTGFRPHPQGAQGIFGVRADLATYGKVIGGGYPIGAIAGRADIMDWVDGGSWQYGDDSVPGGDTTFFGGTYIQHPVSMVAARAVLTWLRDQGPELQQRLNAGTDRLASTLNDFCEAEGFPVGVRHFGSLFRLAHKGNLELLFNHLILEGVHVWEWRNFFLSTAHTDADVDFVIDAVRNSLYDLRRGGFLPGRPAPSPAPRTALPRIPAASPELPVGPRPAEVGATTPDFSLYFFGDYPREQDGDKYAAILAAARFADHSGLHAVWLPERHFDSFGGVFPNPSVLAAAIAAQTNRVRLHAGCVVLPLHDPIRVAEEWSVVDNLSGGRVGLGVASGWHARDFVLAPEVYGRHREAMYEGVDTIRALWRGDAVRRTAGNGEQVDVRLFPRPVQDEPPFFTAIVGNPDSYRQAAAAGLGVITNLMSQSVEQLAENIALYRASRAEHGLDPAGGRVVVLMHTYLGTDTGQVRAEAYRPFCDYLRSSLALFGQVTNSLGFSIDLEHTPEEDLDFLLSRAYQRYCADRALIGSPSDCEAIVRTLAGLGVDEIACFVDFGLSPSRIMAGLPGIDRLRSAFTIGSTEDIRPLTPAQHQIWYLDQILPNRPTHTESQVVLLEGELDVAVLRRACDAVVARHDSLRSVFRLIDGEPRQVVSRNRTVELPVLDDPGATVADAARRAAAEETEHAFDLATGPLFEPRLIRLDDRRHLLVLRMHHLVVDTWSAEILSAELSACYRAFLAGTEPRLAEPGPLPLPANGSWDLDYWVDLLDGVPRDLPLPAEHPRPAEPSGRGATVTLVLDDDLTGRVKELARRSRVTTFMVLFAAFATVLRRYTGRTELVVGTPVADRPEGTEKTVGFLVNTLPLRVTVPDDASFADLVRQVRGLIITAQEHGDVPFPEIVRAAGGSPDPLRNPLFDVVVEFDNGAVFELDLPGVLATLLDVAVDRAPLDLTLFLTNLGGQIRCRLNYAVDLFDSATPGRILEQFRHIIDSATASPDRPLGELPALPPAELAVLDDWQDGGPPPPSAGLLHAELSEVDGIAVVDEHGPLDRAGLFQRANDIGAALEVEPGQLVAVYLPRSADAVAGMLASLRRGAGYLPLDPEQPPARLRAILDVAKVSVVITRAELAGTLPDDLPVVLVDRLPAGVAPECPPASQDDVAYVLFTSGSTGVPKGCVIEHRAIANLVAWATRELGLTRADRVAWFSSPGFDASCVEVWPATWAGASILVVPGQLRFDPERLRDWLVDNGITVVPFMPTPMCELLLDLPWPESCALRHLVTGGDRLRRRPPAGLPFQVWNGYGPTEATVYSTVATVSARGDGPPSIGRPVPGTWVRVLDEHGRQVPIGVPGELYLGGTQLAREYANAAEETARRFLEHPSYGRVYRTGDMVRWRSGGELEFLGRNDAQVQIRGFRVEPGEVEHHLRGLDGVREAAVVGWTDGDAYLAAYVVPAGDGVTVDRLRAALAERLPEYLVPTVWTLLTALPLNASGKLDRNALPEPAAPASREDSVPPATPLERRLHDVWCAELGLDSAGVESTFFELGGHSLIAVRLLNRIRGELGRTVGVLDFLQAPTIRAMAARLETADSRVERTAPASVCQARQYRFTVDSDTPSVLTIASRFELRGPLDVAALRTALTALVARHPALRTRYRSDGVLMQEVLAAEPVALPEIEATEAELDGVVRTWAARPFDLDREPAFRAVVFRVAPDLAELLLAMHHGIGDGWSLTVIIRELGELYRAALAGEPPELPALTADFLDFTHWEQGYLADPATQAAIRDWVAEVGGVEPPLLPTDRPRAARTSDAGAVWTHTLPGTLADELTAFATRHGTTPYAVLFATFALLQHELTGAPAAVAYSPVANRVDDRFENVVGVFTHSSWLIVPVAGATTFTELLSRTSKAVWQRIALQSVPVDVINSALGSPFDANPPRVLFSLFNTVIPDLVLSGLTPATPVDVELGGARADQSWLLAALDDGLSLQVEYAVDLFDHATVAAWGKRYLAILRAALSDPNAPLA